MSRNSVGESQQVRILHIDAGREMRGGQWQVLYLMESLRQAGCEQRLLAPASAPLLKAARLRDLAAEPLTVGTVWRHLRWAELAHAHDARAHTLAALFGHPRLVVSRRVAFELQRGPWSGWKYRRACRFLAVSEHVRAVLQAGGVEPRRIAVVYDGVPLLPRSTRSGGIIAPALRDPLKAGGLLEQAARAGGFEIRRSAELERDLREAALFIYLTEREGLGSGALLAMAAGVPVIASRVGGLTEVIRDGETGLLVDNQPEAVAEAVRRLRDDASLAERLAAAGRRQAQDRFSLEALRENTLRVYREVLSC